MGKYKVELLPAAWDDLQDIVAYISEDSSQAAEKMLDRILKSLRRLEDFPYSGSQVPGNDLRKHDFRMVVASPYISIYRFIDCKVVVYHIVHGARDYAQLFKPFIS
jgi:plasmid stabilization system protein ParE